MSERLLATFQYLAKTENEAASEVLVAGLEYPHRTIRGLAVRALLDRRDPKGHREVFRRLGSLGEQCRELVNERPERLAAAVGEALQQPRPEDCAAACDAIVSFRLYGVLPTLISVLTETKTPHAELLARTALTMAESFYAELSGADEQPKRKQRDSLRDRITSCLEDAVRKFHRHRRPEVIEALLLVARPNNATLRQLLQRSKEGSHGPIVDLLQHSARGGVIRLLLGLLDDPRMPRVVRKVIGSRCDLKFVENLLWSITPKPSRIVAQSLARITTIDWAKPEHPLLDELDEKAQIGAVQLMLATAIERPRALAVVRHVLLAGELDGRRAAAEALAQFDEPVVDDLLVQSLDDPDPLVVAAALGQLRQRCVPNAFSLMVRSVGNPHPEVKLALRKAMPEFVLDRFLANLDAMDEELRPTAAQLVRQIDDDILGSLAARFESRSPLMRRRVVLATGAMGLVQELEGPISALLADDDHMVRAAAAEALADGRSMPTWAALRDALCDRSPVVQEAAEQSLERISQYLLRQVDDDQVEEGSLEGVTR